jgi:23S rRNA pseudouridine1911/1915/1917 synthase
MKTAWQLLAETENWVAINKPAGLLSVPDREGKEVSLKRLLQEKYGSIFTVHRLDKDTSGVILFAKNEVAHKQLTLQFEQRTTIKHYVGLVLGKPLPLTQLINSPLKEHPTLAGKMIIHRNGKPSQTVYTVEETLALYSWVHFELLTGRTHQIRVHMQSMGHPLACDAQYGDGQPILLSRFKPGFKIKKDQEAEKPLLSRLALHALRLQFQDLNGETIKIEADLPADLQVTVLQLRKYTRRSTAGPR